MSDTFTSFCRSTQVFLDEPCRGIHCGDNVPNVADFVQQVLRAAWRLVAGRAPRTPALASAAATASRASAPLAPPTAIQPVGRSWHMKRLFSLSYDPLLPRCAASWMSGVQPP